MKTILLLVSLAAFAYGRSLEGSELNLENLPPAGSTYFTPNDAYPGVHQVRLERQFGFGSGFGGSAAQSSSFGVGFGSGGGFGFPGVGGGFGGGFGGSSSHSSSSSFGGGNGGFFG